VTPPRATPSATARVTARATRRAMSATEATGATDDTEAAGFDVLESIATQEIAPGDRPVEDIVTESMEIERP
jgi:hypothetical protein